MNERHEKVSFVDELKRDYQKARDKRDFMAMREIYIELWKHDDKNPYPDRGREEIVFFTEVLDDNSVVIPHELPEFLGKECYISLFEDRLDITVHKGNGELVEKYLKDECMEFESTTIQDKLELSPLALKSLNVKSGDILRIEVDVDALMDVLYIFNEKDGRWS